MSALEAYLKLNASSSAFVGKSEDDGSKDWEEEPRTSVTQACDECGQTTTIDGFMWSNFGVSICVSCRARDSEKWGLITKTTAKTDYLLTDKVCSQPLAGIMPLGATRSLARRSRALSLGP